MIKPLKTLVAVIIAAVSLLFFLLENPNEFKSELAELVSLNTPYQVSIKGDLAWRYWPPVAIQAEDIILLAPNGNSLARFEHMEIDMDIFPLLGQQNIVEVNSISLTGGWIDYEINTKGDTNWTTPNNPSNKPKESRPPPTVHRFNLEDLTINYRAEQSYALLISHLATSKLAIDSPFDISTSIEILNQDIKEKISLEATGQLLYSSTNRLRFDQLISTIRLKEDMELSIKAAGALHPKRQIILLNEAVIGFDAILASLTGIINYTNEPLFEGELSLEATNLSELADLPFPLHTLQLTSGVTASSQQVKLTAIEAEIDRTRLKGNLAIQRSDPLYLTGDLRLKELYLSSNDPTSKAHSSSTSTKQSNPEILPTALRPHSLDLILRAENIHYGGFDFSAAKVEISSNKNRLELIANSRVLEGKLVASLTSDWSKSHLITSVDRLYVSSMNEYRPITGSLTGHGEYLFKGNFLTDLEETLSGKTIFNIKDGSIDIRPIKNLATTIDSLRGKPSRISTWPDDMHFQNMSAQHLFQHGTHSGQVLNARIENLHLTASGGFDLNRKTLDYELTAMFKQAANGQFNISDQLIGVHWPMHCQGNFSEEPVELCFVQQGAIQELVADIAKQNIKRRGNKNLDRLIEEKVPEQLRDLTRDLLKDLFK